MPGEWTTIRISRATAKRLKALGRMGESYEDVINRLIDEYEKTRRARSELSDSLNSLTSTILEER